MTVYPPAWKDDGRCARQRVIKPQQRRPSAPLPLEKLVVDANSKLVAANSGEADRVDRWRAGARLYAATGGVDGLVGPDCAKLDVVRAEGSAAALRGVRVAQREVVDDAPGDTE